MLRGERQALGALRHGEGAGLGHTALAGHKELVPEEGLQGVEVDARARQEGNVAVGGANVLLVHTVDDEHVGGGELHASHLEAEQCDRELDDVVALHAQLARGRHLLALGREGHLHAGRDVLLVEALGVDLGHAGFGQGGAGRGRG